MKLYMFRTVPLSIIRSCLLHTHIHTHTHTHSNGICHTGFLTACEQDQDGTGRSVLILLYDIYHFCVCSKQLLMMDRGTVRKT